MVGCNEDIRDPKGCWAWGPKDRMYGIGRTIMEDPEKPDFCYVKCEPGHKWENCGSTKCAIRDKVVIWTPICQKCMIERGIQW